MREALERLQAISLEVSEELDAYQDRHGRWVRYALLMENGAERLELARA